MTISRHIYRSLFVLTGLLPLMINLVTMAADEEGAVPTPSLRQTASLPMAYLIMFVLLVLVVVVSVFPSKRGHQD